MALKSLHLIPPATFGEGDESTVRNIAPLPDGIVASWGDVDVLPVGFVSIHSIILWSELRNTRLVNLRFKTTSEPVAGGTPITDDTDTFKTYSNTGTVGDAVAITVPAGAYNAHATLAKGMRFGVMAIRNSEDGNADTYGEPFLIKEIEVICNVGSTSEGTVEAAANAIVTIEEIKDFLKLSGSDHDDFLQEWINKKSSEVEEEIDFKVVPQVLTEIGDGDGTATYTPRYYPIYAFGAVGADAAALLAAVQVRNSVAESWADAVTVADYIITSVRDPWVELYGGAIFPAGRNTVKLIYQPGFNPVPEKLKEAVFLKVVLKAKESGRSIGDGRFGYQSKSTGEGGGTRSTTYKDLEDHIKKLIQPYKRIV